MLQVNPYERITAEVALTHPFFQPTIVYSLFHMKTLHIRSILRYARGSINEQAIKQSLTDISNTLHQLDTDGKTQDKKKGMKKRPGSSTSKLPSSHSRVDTELLDSPIPFSPTKETNPKKPRLGITTPQGERGEDPLFDTGKTPAEVMTPFPSIMPLEDDGNRSEEDISTPSASASKQFSVNNQSIVL